MGHALKANKVDHGNSLSWLNWPVIGGNVTVIAYFHQLWEALPSITVVYTVVTVIFMLFQMADKLGLLESFKRGKKNPPALEAPRRTARDGGQ